ncbi:MAG: biotin-dependent carboxyltransferase family protein [Telmatospirillum sp.]|nr:biotin-dependent carboxyltransferase family protein [Telmatospirillum sp.]
MIEILDDDSQASIQDRGRFGWRAIGVGSSGAMDALALERANLLVGNAADAAAIEIPGTPLRVRFRTAVQFALVGAGAAAKLDGRELLPDSTSPAHADAELQVERPSVGTYSYLAIRGGFEVPVVLGSRSTHLRGVFGGHEGRVLARGDLLAHGPANADAKGVFGLTPPRTTLALPGDAPGIAHVRVLPAAEYDRFAHASRAAFWTTAWKISAQSNRSGYRLIGPNLDLETPLEMRSHGLLPGVIQAPNGGTPIIQLADAFTAGGYPKIGTVIAADLWRVAQAPLGSALRFVQVDYAAARAAQAVLDADRARVRMWIDLCRGLGA